jgi:Rieske Fe-S protein
MTATNAGNRRTFLKWATHGLGALFGLLIGIPAVAYLIDARNRPAPKRGMRRVARLSELEIGIPKQVVIHDIRRDAWTLHPNDVVGRVWLVRQNKDKVDAFTTTCPHLGCSVDYHADQKLFICPCHTGTFDDNGNLVKRAGHDNPAPRGMDSLELSLVKDDASQLDKPDFFIEVRYENYRQGESSKIVKS